MNVWFGLSSSLIILGAAWAMNGYFQSMGAPTCVRLLCHWYSPNELGTKWSLWSISHQVGGGIILILAGYLAQHYGWRSAFFVPAAIAVVCAIFLFERLRDTPEAMGLPTIEDYRNDHVVEHASAVEEGDDWKTIMIEGVLKNRQIWMLSIANFFVYLVRYGAMDWAPTFLVEVKHSTVASAAVKTALFEFLGIAGALFAGWVSDKYFITKRYLINVFYMLVLVFAVWGFWMVPGGYPMVDAALLGAVGFLVYGPQLLVGVCTADVSGKEASATANGLNGFMGYMGSIVSGVGTGWIVQHYGWNGGFYLFIGSAMIGAVLFTMTGSPKKVSASNAFVLVLLLFHPAVPVVVPCDDAHVFTGLRVGNEVQEEG
jgi:sugar phosphate permease